MDYLWKVHKRFLVAVIGGLIAAFVYNSFVIAPLRASADRWTKKLDEERAKLESKLEKGEPSLDALKQAENTRDFTLKQLGQLRQEVVFKASDKFKKPDGNAKSFMDNLKISVPKELHAEAVKARILCPEKVGLDGLDLTEEMADEVLLRLAVLERVVRAAIASGVERIEQIDAMHGGSDPAGKGGYLSRVSLLMRFQGTSESVFKLVHAVQKKGLFLSIHHFEFDRPNPSKDLLSATLAVSALRVDDKAALEAKAQ